MIQPASNNPGYSASVDFWLDCEHGRFELRQISSTFVIVASPRAIPACEGSITLMVDGERFDRPVTLPSGMAPDNTEVTVLARDEHAPF